MVFLLEKEKDGATWSLVGRVFAYQAGSLGFNPLYHINLAWWCMSVFGEWGVEAGGL